MKLQIKNFILIAMMALVTIGGTTSCSSKKKLAKKEYEAKLLQAKTDLNAIIEGTTQWTLEEQKSRIDEIEKSDLQNAEIDELIVKAKEVVEQTINAITFSALFCIFLLLYNLTLIIVRSYDFSWITWDLSIIKAAVSAIAYYVFAVICLNLLLVVKQMSKIIQFNLNVKKGS